MVATTSFQTNGNVTGGGDGYSIGGVRGMVGQSNKAVADSKRVKVKLLLMQKHVVHLSLSEGLDNNFPFGNSLLETIFKVYKQKELLRRCDLHKNI